MQISGDVGVDGWYRSPVSVTFLITDNFFAGVTETQLDQATEWDYREYHYPPHSITDEGMHSLRYRSIDVVRNVEDLQVTHIGINQTPPLANVPRIDGNQLPNGWYTSPVTLTLSAQDLESGLQVLEYKVDEQPWQPYTATVTFADEGIHTIRYRAGDAGGRIETTQLFTVALDLTAPVITTTFPATITYANLLPTAYYTVTDSVSGIITMTLMLNDTKYQEGQTEQPWRLGSNRIEIRAVNHAGLISRRIVMVMVVGQRTYLPLIQAE